MIVGIVLRIAPEQKRLSQQEVADYINVSQKTYANYEAGSSSPSLKALSKLSELLEIDMLEVLRKNGVVFYQSNNHFAEQSTGIVHHMPDKLIEQYEARIKEKDATIQWLREQIERLSSTVK